MLKRAEGGEAVPALCRETGVSTATIYKWRAKFGDMDVSLMARMKELEDEKLKAKVVAEAIAKKW